MSSLNLKSAVRVERSETGPRCQPVCLSASSRQITHLSTRLSFKTCMVTFTFPPRDVQSVNESRFFSLGHEPTITLLSLSLSVSFSLFDVNSGAQKT